MNNKNFLKCCRVCRTEKEIDKFPKGETICKICNNKAHSIYNAEYYNKNVEKITDKNKTYYEKNKVKCMQWTKANREKNPKSYWAHNVLYNHKYKGYNIDISIEELFIMMENTKKCRYCNCDLEYIVGKGHRLNSPSLDRIDNELKLNKDNVQIICYKCNATKLNRNHIEFVNYCKNVYETELKIWN